MFALLPKNLLRAVCQLTLALPALFLCSACDSYDPNYTTLAAAVESNPNPKAIEGMWHRKWGDGLGAHQKVSLLFLPNKTGHFDSLMTDLLYHDDKQGKFTWSYTGNGVWTTVLDSNSPSKSGFGSWLALPTKWRFSGNKLLQETNAPAGNWFMVWERVEP